MRSGLVHISVLCCLLLLAVDGANADVGCSGRINGLYIDSGGGVKMFATFRNDWLEVCNITSPRLGVTTETCKSWVALLTTLQVSQQLAIVRYAGSTACDVLPPYETAPAPLYVLILNQ
jgi:hypothetical protein